MIQITKQRKLWWALSAIVIFSGIAAMVISWQQIGAPLHPSLDFVGGTRLQLELDCTKSNSCDQPIDPTEVRDVLAEQDLANSSIQVLGQDRHAVSIRTSPLEVDQRTKLQAALAEKLGTFDPEKTQIDIVGPVLGQQLFASGMLALIVSFVGITIYLSLRFQLDYAVFALVALFHDVFVTAGIFSILGLVNGTEVDSLFIVAMLTIVGFSVNDTVVIYDRVRETLTLNPNRSIDEVIDLAVNQTLTRSINTTLTTLLPLVAIVLFGGATLKDFALALIIGFLAGVYSSIFIASTLLGLWRGRKETWLPPSPPDEPEIEDATASSPPA